MGVAEGASEEAPSQRKRGLGEERRGVNVNCEVRRDRSSVLPPLSQPSPPALLLNSRLPSCYRSPHVAWIDGAEFAAGSICGAVDFASDVSMLPVLIGGAFLVGAFIGAWWYRRQRTINISDSYGPMLG